MDEATSTLLKTAAQTGDPEMVQHLLDAGIPVGTADNNGWTPLHYASVGGHEKVMRLLLEGGAKVDAADKYGSTALHWASRNGHSVVVEMLLDWGAKISVMNKSMDTPFMLAKRNRHVKVATMLEERANQEKVCKNDDVKTMPANSRDSTDSNSSFITQEVLADQLMVNPPPCERAVMSAPDNAPFNTSTGTYPSPTLEVPIAFVKHCVPEISQTSAPQQSVNEVYSPEARIDNRRDCLVVFQASPLVWIDEKGKRHPIVSPDFEAEKIELIEAIEEAKELGYGEISLDFEEATTKRLGVLLATGRSPVVHFSCHGHRDYLCIENRGTMQQLMVEELKGFVAAGRGRLKLVFISACHSRAAGDAFIAAGVDHVVCCKTNEALRDSAATVFAQSFYTALACGSHLKTAFELARQAVLVSPWVTDSRVEMDKFLLLPEKAKSDPYHDVPIFYTSLSKHVMKRNQQCLCPARTVTSPPQYFVGREVSTYQILEDLSVARLVKVTGDSGIGKSSLTKAAIQYMCERHYTFPFKKYIWVPSTQNLNDDTAQGLHELFGLWKNDGITPNNMAECLSFKKSLRAIVASLYETSTLFVIDARELNSDTAMKKLDLFLCKAFKETCQMKAIVIFPAGRDISYSSGYISRCVCVGQLDVRSSVLLFGHICKFTQQERYSGLGSPNELAEFLVPRELEETAKSAMPERLTQISSLIGEGNPARIHETATKISEEKYNELIQIGIAQLDERIASRISKQLQLDMSTTEGQAFQDGTEKLKKLRETFPALEDFKKQHAELVAGRKEHTTPSVMQSPSQHSSFDGQIVGVDFCSVYMDDHDGWNDYIIKSKEHIEMQLQKLERFGTLNAGKPQISVRRIKNNGVERAVVRLECEFDLRKDLETKEFTRVKEICRNISGFLANAGATEEELKKLMIGAMWKGSLCLLLEAPPTLFSKLFSLFSKGARPFYLQGDQTSERSEPVELVAMAPAFIVTGATRILQNLRGIERNGRKTDAFLWKAQSLHLLAPTSHCAFTKLVSGGTRIWQSDRDEEWCMIPSITRSIRTAYESSSPKLQTAFRQSDTEQAAQKLLHSREANIDTAVHAEIVTASPVAEQVSTHVLAETAPQDMTYSAKDCGYCPDSPKVRWSYQVDPLGFKRKPRRPLVGVLGLLLVALSTIGVIVLVDDRKNEDSSFAFPSASPSAAPSVAPKSNLRRLEPSFSPTVQPTCSPLMLPKPPFPNLSRTTQSTKKAAKPLPLVFKENATVSPLLNRTWQQHGQEIINSNVAQLYGSSVTLSVDGNVMAVGTPGQEESGLVRVFEYNAVTHAWDQMGSDITGDVHDVEVAYSLSLSSNGRRLAVGKRYYSAETKSCRFGIYQFDNTTSEWNQMDIVDKANLCLLFGHSVSLSSEGSILATGAPHTDHATGSVLVLQYNVSASIWGRLGQVLVGGARGSNFGYALACSGTGSVIAIGSPNFSSEAGSVSVYSYNPSMHVWTHLGGQRNNGVAAIGPIDHRFGSSISLSRDGFMFAAAATEKSLDGRSAGYAQTYHYNNLTSSWTKLGPGIPGYSISLSSDGRSLATGSPFNSDRGESSGHVRVYRFNETESDWHKLGQDMFGQAAGDEFGYSVSLSSKGVVAVGANRRRQGPVAGNVKVFRLNE